MQNTQNPNNELDSLIQLVAEKMGKTPEQLQQDLQNGSLQQSGKIKELLGDKEQLNNFLGSPQVKQLLQGLRKK